MKDLKKKFISGTVLVTMLGYTMPIFAFANEETIYSKLDTSGEKYKSIVSTYSESEEINQNEISKELPVDCKITYELDGNVIEAKDLAGKNGKVKITLEYTNKELNQVDINGKIEDLYTPFFIVSGAIINNKNNKNIQISNGKVINDGSKTIVIGVAMPGMQESLNISSEDIEIPSSIEITMDSEEFELGNIMSFCSPEIFEEGDLDKILDKTGELFDKVNELQSASKQIEDGAVKLSDGVVTLNNGAQSLNSGANELNNGIDNLKGGTSKITSGANLLKTGTAEYTSKSKEFNSAMNQVSSGISSLNSNYDEINNGLSALNQSSTTLLDGAKGVSDGAKALSAGFIDVNNALNSIIGGISTTSETITVSGNSEKIPEIQSVIANNEIAINTLVSTNTSLQMAIDASEDEGVKASLGAQIASNTNAIALLQANNNTLSSVITSLSTPVTYTANPNSGIDASSIAKLKGTIDYLATSSTGLAQGAESVYAGVSQAVGAIGTLSAGSSQVKAGLNTLETSTNGLTQANNQLTQAASTIANGVSDLASGAVTLDEGARKLSDGSIALKNGTNELSNGTNTLLEGSNTLVDGIKKFNAEGISEIYNFVNGDLKNTVTRIEKMEDLSNNYNSFTSNEEREAIKFINIIDSVKNSSKEEKEEEIVMPSKEENSQKED